MSREEMIESVTKVLRCDLIDKRKVLMFISTFENDEARMAYCGISDKVEKESTTEEALEERIKTFLGIKDYNLLKKSNKREIVLARKIMSCFHLINGLSLATIGDKYGKGHSNISIGIKSLINIFDTNERLLSALINEVPEVEVIIKKVKILKTK